MVRKSLSSVNCLNLNTQITCQNTIKQNLHVELLIFLDMKYHVFFVKKEWVIWTPDFVDFIVIHKRLHLESLFFDLWRGSADTQNQRKSHYQNYCYCSHIRIQRTWWVLSEPCIIKNLYPLCWYLNSKYTFGLTS